MTRLQEIQIRLSESRSAINTIQAQDGERTDTDRTEITRLAKAIGEDEIEYRAALAAEGDSEREAREAAQRAGVDPETRERLELRGRVSLGAYLAAALSGRLPGGAEAEYGSAHAAPVGSIPLDLWETDRPQTAHGAALETRAVTPAPATGTGQTVAPVQPFVFAPSIAPRLGIEMPSVGSGGYSEMTITTAPPASAKVASADADDTAGALTAVTANPRRLSARMSVSLEDVASVGQSNFEAALRAATSMALSDEYDEQCIAGNGTSPNVAGLINQLTDPSNPTTIATFDSLVATFADQIDGLWASAVRDVSIVANVDAYKLSAKTYRGTAANGGPAITFADYAREAFGGWWTNKRMPATAATIARGIVYRMGRMGMRTAAHPVWNSVAIDDIYTLSQSGRRAFTMHLLVGDKVLLVQPSAYNLVEFKVA